MKAELTRDVIVVGGGAAGLNAALMLARSKRTVTVIDAGQPRNAPADGVHGLLGLEGIDPRELVARGREEVASYGGEILQDKVESVANGDGGFVVTTSSGLAMSSRRLLIATGLVDELPDIPGLRERWGRDVIHCPYCHGYEFRDQRIGVIVTGVMSVHQALLFRQLSDEVCFFAQDVVLEPDDAARLRGLGVEIVEGQVAAVEATDQLSGVRMADGRLIDLDAVAVATRMVARADIFAGIGVEPTEHALGSFIEADPTGRTSVPGAWVAGNSTDLSAQVGASAAAGAKAGAHINADLVMEDANRAANIEDGASHV